MKYKELIEILTQDKYKDLLDEEINIKVQYINDLDFGEINLNLEEIRQDDGKLDLITEIISLEIENIEMQ